MNDLYKISSNDKVLYKTPYSFDVSVWELFWANWYGASLIIAKPDGHKDTDYMQKIIQEQLITIMHFVPSMLEVFLNSLQSHSLNIKHVFCSGEELTTRQLKKCHESLPNSQVHNLYGPTETSIDVLFYDCNYSSLDTVYIGKPIANINAYVLDSGLKPLPIGAIGELYIGGVGLGRGYLGKSGFTAEKFIASPFQAGARLYKTGDLACWTEDGNLQYLGRNDFQVKIRGFRVELGEIEETISGFAGVKQVVVLALDKKEGDGDSKYLVGYYVADVRLNEDSMLAYLETRLPKYMLPSRLVYLESLPVTMNGKLDRKELPEPVLIDESSYVAPRNEMEVRMCEIWADILRLPVEQIGIHDDFFKLGGNSILVITLVNKLRREFKDLEIYVFYIFEYSSICRLSKYLKTKNNVTSYHKKVKI